MRTPVEGQLEPMRPAGPQCFVDWRFVKAGFVGWHSGADRIGVWEPAPADAVGRPEAPFGIRLRAQPAQETIGPVMPRDKPWEYTYHLNSVLYDEGVYRAWYECVPDDHFKRQDVPWPKGHGNVMCYAESDDGFTWRKPALGLAAYYGEEDTNIVYGRNLSPNGLHGGSVFKDPHAPAAERYKLIYMGSADETDIAAWRAKQRARFGDDLDPMCMRDAQSSQQLGASGHLDRERRSQVYWIAGAVSPDGLHWTPLAEPLMVHFSDTLTTASWDAASGRYVGYFRTWRYGRRCVGRAQTEDFRHWPATPETVLQAPLARHPSDDVYTNAKVVYPGSGNTHLMFPAIYHRLDDSREVYMASSVDGVNWQWVPGGPVIRRGELGEWHGGDISSSQGLVPLSGNRMAVPVVGYVHPHKFPRGSAPFGAPGWATWTQGRLSALEAEEVGEFATVELLFSGQELSLNLKCREAGSVLVELRAANGQPVPGHTFADADPIADDSVDRRVTWRGEANIGGLADQPISLAFRLCKTQLFAFEFV